jgi:hypothetical protein
MQKRYQNNTHTVCKVVDLCSKTSDNGVMTKTQSIRELKALQAEALVKYHAEYARLEAEIQALRKTRGTVLKEKSWEDYHEAGRSRERFPGGSQL